ncbi:unnamed protein product [Rodentolepis nana]|uniref:BHLH domain-containing protein n=1 Tax=Rodentolepis nana TaxID=102285 RepID=A0A0R3T3M0_RODNA|nr:unnamed protein product [Rodentolepis nana]
MEKTHLIRCSKEEMEKTHLIRCLAEEMVMTHLIRCPALKTTADPPDSVSSSKDKDAPDSVSSPKDNDGKPRYWEARRQLLRKARDTGKQEAS